jgi:NDP-sugar pyrophosphorylase family protein
MKIIIPMAGTGDRFIKAGYQQPKPFIKVDNKEIIEYIMDMFYNDDEFVLIINDKMNADHILKKYSNRKIDIIKIPQHKFGPIFTVLYANSIKDFINNDEKTIVTYCDNPYKWDYSHFKQFVLENNLDGCILTHTGLHPHSLNSTKMAFLKINKNTFKVEEIKEKECYTDNHLEEHASTGTYYFAKGEYVKYYFDLLIKNKINYKGEYYVTLAYNPMISDGLSIGYYDTNFVTVFGTPEEVKSFEAWKIILNSGQVKNTEDLINVYEYWKTYHKS